MTINRERLRETLARDEGCKLERHQVAEIDHIGYGANLDEHWPDELLAYLDVEDEDDIESITQDQANYLLDYYTDNIAIPDCSKIFGQQWEQLSAVRQEVYVNMAFNLGGPNLRGFRKMIRATTEDDWAGAASQILNSKAARQTGDRYKRLALAFEFDDEKYLELDRLYDGPRDVPGGTMNANDLSAYGDEDLLAELARRLASRK